MGRTVNSQCSLLSPLVILVRPFCPVLIAFMRPVPVSAVFQMSEVGGGFIWGTTGTWLGTGFQMCK